MSSPNSGFGSEPRLALDRTAGEGLAAALPESAADGERDVAVPGRPPAAAVPARKPFPPSQPRRKTQRNLDMARKTRERVWMVHRVSARTGCGGGLGRCRLRRRAATRRLPQPDTVLRPRPAACCIDRGSGIQLGPPRRMAILLSFFQDLARGWQDSVSVRWLSWLRRPGVRCRRGR